MNKPEVKVRNPGSAASRNIYLSTFLYMKDHE
jgi:hypothetical protein